MGKYLIRGSYTVEGLNGLLKEGGSARRKVVDQVAEAFGGTAEAVYFAFGADDFFLIMDLPDNQSAAAVSMISNVSGTLKLTVTVLMTPEEVDQAINLAAEKGAAYRPAGQ